MLSLELFGDAISGELDRAGDVPRLPPRRIGSRINFEQGNLSSYIAFVNAADQNNPGENEEETDGYQRWDAGLQYQLDLSAGRDALVFLRAKNISDEEIRNASSYLRDIAPEAGRSLELGLRVSF
ncbi:TonB-dependent receptor [Oceanicoccus sp. KOV_DT_Chl]|uniref:TonB-dependent receptor n=1 Tax=Oceanicoccus sp. KOV_DT_Chl TaxID=1904639 RepID=UPI001F2680C9|nr:TonB-dependent receptor [Oceanicoccus sp. KOV_DT_Chl]